MTATIPDDIKARLIQAATEVMSEQEFTPLTARDLEIWMTRNAEAIGQRARELQMQMFEKYLKNQGAVDSAICQATYRQIRRERYDG